MLINPRVETQTDIAWICDDCGTMLNEQAGFTEDCGEWTCKICGHVNKIDESELYSSEDEYIVALENPYHGMCDEDILSLMNYEEIGCVKDREDMILVQDEEGHSYIKKNYHIMHLNRR